MYFLREISYNAVMQSIIFTLFFYFFIFIFFINSFSSFIKYIFIFFFIFVLEEEKTTTKKERIGEKLRHSLVFLHLLINFSFILKKKVSSIHFSFSLNGSLQNVIVSYNDRNKFIRFIRRMNPFPHKFCLKIVPMTH